MKITKNILSTITIISTLLGSFRIIPIDISLQILLISSATLIMLENHGKRKDGNANIISVLLAFFFYSLFIYITFLSLI